MPPKIIQGRGIPETCGAFHRTIWCHGKSLWLRRDIVKVINNFKTDINIRSRSVLLHHSRGKTADRSNTGDSMCELLSSARSSEIHWFLHTWSIEGSLLSGDSGLWGERSSFQFGDDDVVLVPANVSHYVGDADKFLVLTGRAYKFA